MKNVLKAFTILGLIAGAFGVGAFSALQRDNVEAEAAVTPQTDRRLYVYLEGGWDSSKMYIHYWGGTSQGTTWAFCPEMTKVLSDYWQGLFYYDVPVDITAFCVKDSTGNVNKVSNQSNDIMISDLFVGTNYKVATVKAWVANGSKRAVSTAENAPASSGQIAAILNHINSCSTSYAVGHNAWPQLNDLFISPSSYVGSTVVIDNFGPDTTIDGKIAYLQFRYSRDGGSSSVLVSPETRKDSTTSSIILLTSISITALGGYFFLQKKKFL